MSQHRLIIIQIRADVAMADAQRHWRERHAEVYRPAPGLAGYVQNRPLEEEWERLGRRAICSETWFPDHDAERASFSSPYYHDTVKPDEETFLDRGSAWMGRVVEEPPWPAAPARYRVLAFGAEALGGHAADVLLVDRDPPAGGPRQILSAWLDDREHALQLARSATPFAFAAEPAVLVPPA